MAELALDQRQRGSFVRQLDDVPVARLVWRHPTTDLCLARGVVKLGSSLAA